MELGEEKLALGVLEEEPVLGVAEENSGACEAAVALDCPSRSSAEKGYGASEVVRLVSQHSVAPRPCPGGPAQHQLLPLVSQRLTSVKLSN